MSQKRPALFRGRHFQDVIIVLCVRWYLRYSLTYRDLEEMMEGIRREDLIKEVEIGGAALFLGFATGAHTTLFI